MRYVLALALLLAAFPAGAVNWISCAKTAKTLDEGYQQADEAAQRGDLSTASKLRKGYARDVDIFLYTCLKPHVGADYFREVLHYLPPEYAKKPGTFTAFSDMWAKADADSVRYCRTTAAQLDGYINEARARATGREETLQEHLRPYAEQINGFGKNCINPRRCLEFTSDDEERGQGDMRPMTKLLELVIKKCITR